MSPWFTPSEGIERVGTLKRCNRPGPLVALVAVGCQALLLAGLGCRLRESGRCPPATMARNGECWR